MRNGAAHNLYYDHRYYGRPRGLLLGAVSYRNDQTQGTSLHPRFREGMMVAELKPSGALLRPVLDFLGKSNAANLSRCFHSMNCLARAIHTKVYGCEFWPPSVGIRTLKAKLNRTSCSALFLSLAFGVRLLVGRKNQRRSSAQIQSSTVSKAFAGKIPKVRLKAWQIAVSHTKKYYAMDLGTPELHLSERLQGIHNLPRREKPLSRARSSFQNPNRLGSVFHAFSLTSFQESLSKKAKLESTLQRMAHPSLTAQLS